MKKTNFTKKTHARLFNLPLLSLIFVFTFSSCHQYLDILDELHGSKPEPVPDTGTARLFVSNASATNTLHIYDPADAPTSLGMPRVVQTDAEDGNGVAVAPLGNMLFQVGRTDGVIKIFGSATKLTGTPPLLTSFSDPAMTSGREIAFDEDRQLLYVANNVDSTILVYNNPVSWDGMVSSLRKFKVAGQPWGIHFDKANNRLFVLLDLEARTIEVYNNPGALQGGKVTPDRSFKIAGSTRLHGITYSSKADVLIVTEIGAAAGGNFASDGGIYIFENAKNVINSSKAEVMPTRTIKGAVNTSLGNPVDVAYDDRNGKKRIYVAEKANKKILVFKLKDEGDVKPMISADAQESPEAIFLDVR